MKYYEHFESLIAEKRLSSIEPCLKGELNEVLVLTGDEAVYGCLKKLEGEPAPAACVLINNEGSRARLVLMNHSRPVLCLGYDEQGYLDAVLPLRVNKNRGTWQQLFSWRYILFMPLPEKCFRFGPSALQTYVEKKTEDQKQLSAFMKGLNGKAPLTDELLLWWMKRY